MRYAGRRTASPSSEILLAQVRQRAVRIDEKDDKTTVNIHALFASVAMRNAHVGMGYVQGVGSGT